MAWTLTKCLEQLKQDYPDHWQLYYFGKPCKAYKHKFHGSDWCVRQKSDSSCVLCKELNNKSEKSRKKRQERYQKEKETVALQSRNYAAQNPEILSRIKRNYRGRKANSLTDSGDYKATLYTMFERSCAYCGKPLEYNDVHLDHVLALINKGSTTFRNSVPSCRSCNTSKQDSCLLLWYPRQVFFSRDRLFKIVNHCAKK